MAGKLKNLLPLSRQDRVAFLLLSLISLFLYADQNLMAPNLTQIGRDFGFNAMERDLKLGGHISLIYWLLGGTLSLGMGYLTDKTARKKLFLSVIILGEIPCLLTGFANSYTQLFWYRALTGIGLGGAMPIIYSLLGDYFPADRRAAASAVIGLAIGLGIALGQLLAGFLGPVYGWRLPFILVALPNFVLALLYSRLAKEPVRGQAEAGLQPLIQQGQIYVARINWKEYKQLFRIKTNLLAFAQSLFGTVPWGVFFIYLNDFLAQDKGFSVQAATTLVMAMGAGVISGGFLGGMAGNFLYNRRSHYLPAFCAASTFLGILPTIALINYPVQPAGEAQAMAIPLLLGFLTGFVVAMTGPNIRAMLLNVNAPETRGSIFSLFTLSDDLGKGLGPAVISLFILAFGRLWAFNLAALFWLVCGILLLFLIKTFPGEEARLQEILRANIRQKPLKQAQEFI